MRTLYLECNMGAAGDMLSAALLELLPEEERDSFVDKLNALGLPGVTFAAEPAVKCGVTGTHMRVTVNEEEERAYDLAHGHVHSHEHSHSHDHEHESGNEHEHEHSHSHSHHHAGMHDIEHLVSHMSLHPDVERDVLGVYGLIAQAESHAHGAPVEEIHFHEVGTLDAVADVTAVCMLMRTLGPRQVVCSPVHVGSGQVRCAHGILPVPAPATAHILQGVPTYGGEVQGELCTPTGAALLKWFVNSFGPSPIMRVERVGYGMGTKDFPAMNGVRAMLGETADSAGDTVAELSCNLDDMTPEAVAFAAQRLMEAGALDVFTVAIGMKKGRPGVMLTCLCRPEDRESMTRLLFSHTSTLGVREQLCNRQVLSRSQQQRQTRFGTVTVKVSEGWGVRREKAEYEDLARIAVEQGLSLEEVRKKLGL